MDSGVIVAILLAGVLPVAILIWALWYMRGDTDKIKNGISADAVVESLAETGTTISSPGLGPDAPVFKFGLLVTHPTELRIAPPQSTRCRACMCRW